MEQLLSNPRGLVIILCFGGLVLALNLTLVAVLRGDKRFAREASRWSKAFGAGRDVREKNETSAAELHRLVEQLKEQEGRDEPDDQ